MSQSDPSRNALIQQLGYLRVASKKVKEEASTTSFSAKMTETFEILSSFPRGTLESRSNLLQDVVREVAKLYTRTTSR